MLYRTVRNKNYGDVSIHPDWKIFSSFKEWHDKNYTEGWDLDKDLLVPGNPVYGPDTCIYVPVYLNNFIACKMSNKGDQPLGVRARGARYTAQISTPEGQKHLGTFDTPLLAHLAWYEEKMRLACLMQGLCDNIHPDLFNGLIENVKLMREKI